MPLKTGFRDDLRQAIMARRNKDKESKHLVFDGSPDSQLQMSPQDKAKKERRKEQNRRAAQRCRLKKRQNQNRVLHTFQNIINSNRDLREEMLLLKSERDHLQMTWASHCTSCPLLSPSGVHDPTQALGDIKSDTSNIPLTPLRLMSPRSIKQEPVTVSGQVDTSPNFFNFPPVHDNKHASLANHSPTFQPYSANSHYYNCQSYTSYSQHSYYGQQKYHLQQIEGNISNLDQPYTIPSAESHSPSTLNYSWAPPCYNDCMYYSNMPFPQEQTPTRLSPNLKNLETSPSTSHLPFKDLVPRVSSSLDPLWKNSCYEKFGGVQLHTWSPKKESFDKRGYPGDDMNNSNCSSQSAIECSHSTANSNLDGNSPTPTNKETTVGSDSKPMSPKANNRASQASLSPNLVNKYPDLCRQLQRPSTTVPSPLSPNQHMPCRRGLSNSTPSALSLTGEIDSQKLRRPVTQNKIPPIYAQSSAAISKTTITQNSHMPGNTRESIHQNIQTRKLPLTKTSWTNNVMLSSTTTSLSSNGSATSITPSTLTCTLSPNFPSNAQPASKSSPTTVAKSDFMFYGDAVTNSNTHHASECVFSEQSTLITNIDGMESYDAEVDTERVLKDALDLEDSYKTVKGFSVSTADDVVNSQPVAMTIGECEEPSDLGDLSDIQSKELIFFHK